MMEDIERQRQAVRRKKEANPGKAKAGNEQAP